MNRVREAVSIALAALGCCLACLAQQSQRPATQPVAAAAQAANPLVHRVAGVSITVSDLERSVQFFTQVLDCQVLGRSEVVGDDFERLVGVFGAHADTATLALGDERLELIAFRAPAGRPIPPDTRNNDRTFQHIAIVVSDMDKAFARVRSSGTRFSSNLPQTLPDWNPRAGGIRAFYFRDPDGHALELIWFPPDKGDPRWHRPTQALFLGIDHTAIVVQDTERSLQFYRSFLGFQVAGESENFGVEQEHLNGVFGAHLRITGLRAPGGGPGVEFLEYLAPSNGRAAPEDSSPTDLWHWHTILHTSGPVDQQALRSTRIRPISGGPRKPGEGRPAVMVRDPDGHAVLLSQSPWPSSADSQP